MKILVVSDEESPALWDYYTPGKLADYDLIISCGDLKSSYLSFLVTMARCPVLYVRGNHDDHYLNRPPDGCDCIDGGVVEYNGIRFLGLGGCLKYHPGDNQYTEKEMRRRIRRLRFPLWRSKGVDVVVTHAPPRNMGDGDDLAHHGFECFRDVIEKYGPKYFLHGHVHLRYGNAGDRVREHRGTTLINACERYVLEIPDVPVPEKKRNVLIWRTRQP